MRKMFHTCRLVHADLSEYNILYHESHLYIIDVSQSVEQDHPSAFDFLRNDIKNAEEFFGRLGVKCLGLRRCFEFITKEKLGSDGGNEEDEAQVLARWLEEEDVQPHSAENGEDSTTSAAHEDSVFLQSYIPRTLNEVFDPERDVEVVNRGEGKGLIYSDTIGLVAPPSEKKPSNNTKVRFEGDEADSDDDDSSGSEEDTDEDGDSDVDGEGFVDRKPRGHRHEDREAKKVHLNFAQTIFSRR